MLVEAPKRMKGVELANTRGSSNCTPDADTQPSPKTSGLLAIKTDLGSGRSHGGFGEAQPMKEMANHSSILA